MRRVAGVSLAGAGATTALNVTNISGAVAALSLDGSGGLVLGGSFQITPERDNPAVLARVALGTSAVTSVVPYYETPRSLARPPISGTSGALELVHQGGTLLVAGDFSDYGVTVRNGLAAYDLATGALRPDFDPSPDAQVLTVKSAANGEAVFVGGEFNAIAGQTRNHIAKLDIQTGQNVAGFTASANSYVKDMAVRTDGSTVYVGGNFDVFNGVNTSRLVAINAQNGASQTGFSMPLTQPTNDNSEGGLRAMALSADETRLMVIGNFRQIDGLDRPLMAQIDVSGPTATVTGWRTDLYDQPCARAGKVGWMRDIDISPDSSTAYVVTSGHFYYPACDTVNAFATTPAGTNQQPIWSKKIGDTLESVAADRDTIYIGGHFRYLETETHTQPRFQVAALDPATGEGLNWVPNAGGLLGVRALELEPAGLFAGSDGDAFDNVNHGRNAFWPNPAPGIEVRKEPSRPWVLAPSGSVDQQGPGAQHLPRPVRDRHRADRRATRQPERIGLLLRSRRRSPPASCTTCTTAAETISGSAPSDGVLDGHCHGGAAGTTVTDTDRSTVQVIATAPGLPPARRRGAGQVDVPRRDRSLRRHHDEPRHRTVGNGHQPDQPHLRRPDQPSAACRAPVGPNSLVTCHVDRFVSRVGRCATVVLLHGLGDLQHRHADLDVVADRHHQPARRRDQGARRRGQPGDAVGVGQEGARTSSRTIYSITYADDDTVQVAERPRRTLVRDPVPERGGGQASAPGCAPSTARSWCSTAGCSTRWAWRQRAGLQRRPARRPRSSGRCTRCPRLCRARRP